MEEDWKGQLYCGIILNWNYDKVYVDISIPNYVANKLTEYGYKPWKRQQYCPYEPNPIIYGKNSDSVVYEEYSPPLNDKDKKIRPASTR